MIARLPEMHKHLRELAAQVAVLTATVVAIDLRKERSHGGLLCVGSGVSLLLGGLAAFLL